MSEREYLGLGRAWMKRPRCQDETKLGNAAVTSRDGAEGSLSGRCSLQDASRFSGSGLGSLAVVREAHPGSVYYYLLLTYTCSSMERRDHLCLHFLPQSASQPASQREEGDSSRAHMPFLSRKRHELLRNSLL